MEKQENTQDMLQFLVCPGFLAGDSQIIQVNEAAGRLFLAPGMEIEPLLVTGKEEYAALTQGCLYLTVHLAGVDRGAVVTVVNGNRLFLVDQDQALRELQVLALAAQELRTPLSNIMISADRIVPAEDLSRAHQGRMNRSLSQMLRLVGNMSDALRYSRSFRGETRNASALLDELFEKAKILAQQAGVSLTYQGLDRKVYTVLDPEQLERAVYNLLSNALKFTPAGGTIRAVLTCSGSSLRLSIQDSGSGIARGVLQNVFTRYLREPSLEDSRYGLGLGLVLVRAAAMNHGGTVLIDQPDAGTRVTMTLAIRQEPHTLLRSPGLQVDYAGERDHGLLELSEVLPPELYE